jgi:hypothetical protein
VSWLLQMAEGVLRCQEPTHKNGQPLPSPTSAKHEFGQWLPTDCDGAFCEKDFRILARRDPDSDPESFFDFFATVFFAFFFVLRLPPLGPASKPALFQTSLRTRMREQAATARPTVVESRFVSGALEHALAIHMHLKTHLTNHEIPTSGRTAWMRIALELRQSAPNRVSICLTASAAVCRSAGASVRSRGG